MCVCVCFSKYVGSETWISTDGVGSDNLCGEKILGPTTLMSNFSVKTLSL